MTRTIPRIVISLLLVLALFFIARHASWFPRFKNPFAPKPIVVVETPVLVKEIKNIAQLLTVEAYNEVVVDSVRYPFGVSPRVFNVIPGNPLGLIGASQLVLIVRGKVIAGVDLKNWAENTIQIKGDSLFIQLPPAVVLEVISNPSDVETFIEKGAWDASAATALQLKARNKMTQQALAQGALQQADSKARNLVYALFKNMGYKAVLVTTVVRATMVSGKQ